jgi:dihydroxy-acid dehydratase
MGCYVGLTFTNYNPFHYDRGCDKNMPGCIMAMGRLNRPGIMIYGGTIRAGKQPSNNAPLDIVSAFQSYGQYLYDKISDEERREIIQHSCPGPGACGGMYTANTMATAIEALGMSLPYSSSSPADSQEKRDECLRAGAAMRNLLEKDIKPRDIMTKGAFENAIRMVMVTGGSTNAVLHLIAMSRSVQDPNVAITLDDFQRISNEVSCLDGWCDGADLRCWTWSKQVLMLLFFRLHSWPT